MHLASSFLALGVQWAAVCVAAPSPIAVEHARRAIDSIRVTNLDDVRGNLHLPGSWNGLNVTWSSTSPSIISHDGIVKRRNTEAEVDLVAAIDVDGTVAKRTFTAKVARQAAIEPFVGYAFAYFTGNSVAGEKIFFAASNGNNALSWKELNGGRPVLQSTLGTKGLRDPFIIRSHEGDRFFLIATDLSIGSGTSWGDSVRSGSRYLEVWESKDLITWSAQRHVRVSPPTAGNTWAPEAYYDSSIGEYVVYWASSLYAADDTNHTGSTYHRMLFATTRDFVTFSKTTVWQDAGMSRIDSTVLREGNTFYRFTKDEGASGTGCADIIQERSDSLRAPLSGWTRVAACIGKRAGTSAVEGPTAFKSNPNDVHGKKFYLFVDEYGGRGYIPLETADIANSNWKVSGSYQLPRSPRHGTVIPVTAQELANLNTLTKASVAPTPSKRSELENASLVARDSPVLAGLYADPNIAIFNRTYYIYATTDGFPGWGGQVFYVWQSPDLVTWTRSSTPILTLNGTSGNVPWASGNAWAPTITERDGKYYFYFSGHNPTYNRKTIGVAIASSPTGPFTAQPTAMILNNENITTGQAIDPATFYDPVTKKYYLFWGNGTPALYAELDASMTALAPGTLRAITPTLPNFREGIFVNYRNGLYHLTYSIDDTGSENYRVGYATAPSVHGPWTYRGVVLQKDAEKGILGTGHSSIVNVPGTDHWYIAYHRFRIPGGDGTHRETTVDKVVFEDGTGLMRRVVPTLESVEGERVP